MSRHTGVRPLAQVTNYQRREAPYYAIGNIRVFLGTSAMEALKIYLLIALLSAIAIAAYRKDRRSTPEQPT